MTFDKIRLTLNIEDLPLDFLVLLGQLHHIFQVHLRFDIPLSYRLDCKF